MTELANKRGLAARGKKRMVLAAALTLLALPALSGVPFLAPAATLAPPRNGDYGDWGIGLNSAGDVNGDGYDDLLVTGVLPNGVYSNSNYTYLYLGAPGGVNPTPVEVTVVRPLVMDGVSARSAGDLNGDGHDEFAVAIPFAEGPMWNDKVIVYGWSDTGVPQPVWGLGEASISLKFAGAAGDVNGDGYGDLIISGAAYPEEHPNGVNGARVFFGSPEGVENTPACEVWKYQESLSFAADYLPVGDLNGDGYDDVVIYSEPHGWSSEDPARYFLHLYRGGPGGLSPAPDWEAVEWSVPVFPMSSGKLAKGDINGDGMPDLVFGAPLAAPTEEARYEGGVFVYFGQDGAYEELPGWGWYSGWVNSWCGESVAVSDVNGDGYGDVIVGAGQWGIEEDSATMGDGRIFVFYGGPEGPGSAPDLTLTGASDFYGRTFAQVGDLNGDGIEDFAIRSIADADAEGVMGDVQVFLAENVKEPRTGGIGPLCFVALLDGAR